MKKNSSNQKSQKFYNQLIQKSVCKEVNIQNTGDRSQNLAAEFNAANSTHSAINETKKKDTLALRNYL